MDVEELKGCDVVATPQVRWLRREEQTEDNEHTGEEGATVRLGSDLFWGTHIVPSLGR